MHEHSTDPAPIPLAANLTTVAAHFRRAALGGPDTILEAVAGIRLLANAPLVARGHCEPAVSAAVASALRNAVPAICGATGPDVFTATVLTGMAAARVLANLFAFAPADLATNIPITIAADALDEALLLGDVLDADLRRREIAARGNPLRRLFAIQHAEAEPRANATLN